MDRISYSSYPNGQNLHLSTLYIYIPSKFHLGDKTDTTTPKVREAVTLVPCFLSSSMFFSPVIWNQITTNNGELSVL